MRLQDMPTAELLRRFLATEHAYGEECDSTRLLRRELERRVTPPAVPGPRDERQEARDAASE